MITTYLGKHYLHIHKHYCLVILWYFVLGAEVPLLLRCSMLQTFDWLAALLPLLIGSEPYVQHAESI